MEKRCLPCRRFELRLSAIRHGGNDAPSCQSSRDQPTLHQVYRCRTRRTNRWKTHDYLRNGRSTRLQLSNQGGLLDGRVRPLPSSTAHKSPWRPLRICYLQRAFLVGRLKRRTGRQSLEAWRLAPWSSCNTESRETSSSNYQSGP